MCVVSNKSHNIIKRFPSRCFAIKSSGLKVPRIFSILSSWFFCFYGNQKYFCLHVFDGAPPAAEDQPACCCSTRPDSYVSLVSQLSYNVGQPRWLHSHSVACCRILTPRCSMQHLLCSRPSCQGVLTYAQASSRCRAPRVRATNCVSIGESIDLHDALFVLQRELPHGTWRVE